jgi:hypothetical protein
MRGNKFSNLLNMLVHSSLVFIMGTVGVGKDGLTNWRGVAAQLVFGVQWQDRVWPLHHSTAELLLSSPRTYYFGLKFGGSWARYMHVHTKVGWRPLFTVFDQVVGPMYLSATTVKSSPTSLLVIAPIALIRCEWNKLRLRKKRDIAETGIE